MDFWGILERFHQYESEKVKTFKIRLFLSAVRPKNAQKRPKSWNGALFLDFSLFWEFFGHTMLNNNWILKILTFSDSYRWDLSKIFKKSKIGLLKINQIAPIVWLFKCFVLWSQWTKMAPGHICSYNFIKFINEIFDGIFTSSFFIM